MTLVRYEVFRTVVEEGSLSKAAEIIGLTQSAVSHAIASLESDFGVTLLSRGRNGIKLTSNGKRVLHYIREVLHSNERLLQEVSKINGLEVGTVRVGTLPSISIHWMPQMIKYFNDQFPNVKIELYEGDYDSIENWLLDGTIELGFLSGSSAKSIEIIPLAKDRLYCIVPKSHQFSKRTKLELTDLEGERFIMPKSSIDRDVRTLLKNKNIKPIILYEISEDQAIMAMVQHEIGISVLPKMTMSYIPEEVVLIPLNENYYRQIGIASKSFKQLIPVAKKLVEVIEQWVEQQ